VEDVISQQSGNHVVYLSFSFDLGSLGVCAVGLSPGGDGVYFLLQNSYLGLGFHIWALLPGTESKGQKIRAYLYL